MSLQLALLLFKLINTLVTMFEQQQWYQQGKAAANAEANAEVQKRIELANAARADADQFASGGVHDPAQRD